MADNGATRDELYAEARKRGIDGRSSMDKAALVEALAGAESGARSGTGFGTGAIASRVEEFAELARRVASGHFVLTPRMLDGHDRRMHVRQTIREDHTTRIMGRAADTPAKFDALAGSLFSFFRGTSLLFYRDMPGEDARMPTVMTLGDVHPGNFGIMPNADNVPIFGVNDFDDAGYAPFTWDLKRGTTAFLIAAADIGGHKSGTCRKVARRFVEGYLDGIGAFARDGNELGVEMRADNAPPLIREAIEDSLRERDGWLAKKYHDERRRGFRPSEDIVPISAQRDVFQASLDRLVRDNGISLPGRIADAPRVKDVAIRRGQGTASLGLPRYYLMLEGMAGDGSDDLIIEFKRARRAAIEGLAPSTGVSFALPADGVVHAQAVHLVRGDVFYGSVLHEGESFMSRERAPFRGDVDLDELDKKGWKRYADICGRLLAHAHALSDELGEFDEDVEPLILEAAGPATLFVEDMLAFGEESAARVRRDHGYFRADHARGAFESVDHVYT